MKTRIVSDCRCRRNVLAVIVLNTATAAAAADLPWEVWKSPYAIAQLDPADQVLERSSYCLDGCRYDHANLTWEGFAANPYPYRWLYSDGAEEVMFDDIGPGAITRIWMTAGNCIDPVVGIRIYVDDNATPALDIPLQSLFDGTTPPFTPPLAYAREQSSGGYVSYVPIAYAQRLRIALTNADNGYNSCTGDSYRALWFQFQYHHTTAGSAVASFSGADDVPALRAFLAHAGDDPWARDLDAAPVSGELVPAASLELANREDGPRWLRGLRLHLPRDAYAHVALRIRIDGIDTVDAPLADFFAVGDGLQGAAHGVLVGEGADGWLYAWFPMPFRQGASVSLQSDASAADIGVDAEMYWDDAAVADNAAPFAAQLRDTCPTTPGSDFLLYDGPGSGRVVGVSAAYRAYAATGLDYLEGDERAYRNGAIAPAWYGTGVEDFFNGGFYFVLGPYSRALSGATSVDADGTGVTSAYRLLLADFLDFQSGLQLRQEAGPTGQRLMCARSVAYAYAVPQPSLIPYGALDLGDPASLQRTAYVPPADSSCAMLDGSFGDEPATALQAQACAFTSGFSSFVFALHQVRAPLRLRRTFDAGQPGAPAEIRINGALAGHFPFAPANAARRWQQQEALLNIAGDATTLQFEIRPDWAHANGASMFSESRYELLGAPTDEIFTGDFDGG